MSRQRISFALATVGLLAGLATSPSAAQPPSPSLTGTWQGSWTCNTLGDGVPTVIEQLDVVVEITHVSDTEVRMSTVAGLPLSYNGFAVGWENEPNKGAVTFVGCDTGPDDFEYNEVLSVRFDTSTGNMGGFSTFNERHTWVGGACRWQLTHVDTADPGVQPCITE